MVLDQDTELDLGVSLWDGCRLVHETAAIEKRPFPNLIPHLTLHQLTSKQESTYCGQIGLIRFTEEHRLPRHVHIATDRHGRERFVAERIFVSAGVALVELSGIVYIVPPNTLTTIAPGVPHTWTACPAGIRLPDGEISHGSFLMLYQYQDQTAFDPTDQVEKFNTVMEYRQRAFHGDLNSVRFPRCTKEAVVEGCQLLWGNDLVKAELE